MGRLELAPAMQHMDAVARSRQLYKRKRYRLALEILESNMRGDLESVLSADDAFHVLELRAALYEHEGRLRDAKNDASVMIRLRPRDPRGYLRLGRILQQTPGRLGEAVTVYQRGRAAIHGQISSSDASVALLSKLERSAAAKLAKDAEVRRDPIGILPRELLYEIFRQVGLRKRVVLTQVSRQWRDYLDSEPRLWNTICFDAGETLVSSLGPGVARGSRLVSIYAETVVRYCIKSAGLPLHLDVSGVGVRKPETLLGYLSRYARSSLETLRCRLSPSPLTNPLCRDLKVAGGSTFATLRVLSISSDCLDADLVWCLATFPSLESLEIHSTARNRMTGAQELHTCAKLPPNLHRIVLVGFCGSPCLTETLAQEIAAIPSLTSLDMHRIIPRLYPPLEPALATNKCLERFGFTAEGVIAKQTPVPCPQFASSNLNSLTLNNIYLYLSGTKQSLPLRYLELKNTRMSDQTLADILVHLGDMETLETLVVHQAAMIEPTVRPLKLPELHTLQFTGMHQMDDTTFQWILDAMPQLRKANFDGTSLSGPKLLRLVGHGLRVVRCRGIEGLGADTTAWLRTHPQIKVYF